LSQGLTVDKALSYYVIIKPVYQSWQWKGDYDMEVINGIDRLPAGASPLYLALGNFDGVHRGHQAIIKSAVQNARREGGASAALVFDPHPAVALRPDMPLPLLTDIADRAEIMAGLHLDYFIVESFTGDMASLSPEQFIRRILLAQLGTRAVFIGADYSFGQQGAGSAETMRYWSNELGFAVEVIPMFKFDEKVVSSSKIRSLLLSGAVGEAAELLNYYFFRQGKVVRGYGIGRKMVYPTANIAAGPRLLWPGKGVYLTAIGNLKGGPYYGVTNVGARPTFSHYDPVVETHILDFSGSLYNREIRVCFLEKLRDTKTFSSSSQLKEQIGRDIGKSRELIDNYWQGKTGKIQSLQAGCSMLRS